MTRRAASALVSAFALLLTGCAGADQPAVPAAAPVAAPVSAPGEPAPQRVFESESETAAPSPAPEIPAPEISPPEIPPPLVMEPEEPVFSVFRTTPEWTIEDLDGRTADAVRALLGAPNFVRADPPAAYWRYGGAGCALDVFLHAETAEAPRTVRHINMRWDSGAKTAAECLNRLRRAHPKPDKTG